MTEPSTVELSMLRTFSPLDGLKGENLRALARKTTLRDLGQGRVLFKEGDTDKRTYYLVSGAVDLLTDGHRDGSNRAGSREARHALAGTIYVSPNGSNDTAKGADAHACEPSFCCAAFGAAIMA